MTKEKLLEIGRQILASMAIAIILFIIVQSMAQAIYGLEVADKINTPLFLNLLAIAAFPFVRRFMK